MPQKQKGRFSLWEISDPNLEYLERPDMTLEEFDKEFPNFEGQSGDWELVELPVWIRILRGYRKLLLKEHGRENGHPEQTLDCD